MIVNPGIRRFLGSTIQRLFNSAAVELTLTHSAIPTRGSITPAFTRATTETGQKWDEAGYLDFVGLAGEIVFKGARRERNLIPTTRSSQDFTLWDKVGVTVVADQYAAPDGTTTMDKLLCSAGNAQHILLNGAGAPIAFTTGQHCASVYLRYVNHRYAYVSFNDNTSVPVVTVDLLTGTITGTTASATSVIETTSEAGVYRLGLFRASVANANGSIYIGANGTAAAAVIQTWNAVGTEAVGVWGASLNDITGETDQTTIRPYVSVGALIHDSQDPNYYSSSGAASHLASTPDSSAGSITGPKTIIVRTSLASVAPAGFTALVDKITAGGLGYGLYQTSAATGTLSLFHTTGGVTLRTPVSTATLASVGIAVNTWVWLKVEHNTATGDVSFWYSLQSTRDVSQVVWVQLGTTVASTSGVDLDTAALLGIVGRQTSGLFTSTNLVDQVLIYSGSTLAIDFNPDRDATTPTGTITSSTTGEVWTLNGASSVVRNSGFHGSMVDGVKCYDTDRLGNPIATTGSYPIVGYVPWEARTNLCLQSNTFGTAPWIDGGSGATIAQNAIGPEGATSAWTFVDNSAVSTQSRTQDITLTAATHTTWALVGKTSGAQASYPCIYSYSVISARIALCTVDTSNGVATAWTAYTGLTIAAGLVARCRSYNSLFWLVEITYTATANAWQLALIPAATAIASQSTGVIDLASQGSAVFYGAQTELGAFAGPYIPTTTVAVARNADVLTYTGADVANIKTLACTFSRGVGVSNVGMIASLDDGTAGNTAYSYLNGATQLIFDGYNGLAQWARTAVNAYTPGTTGKVSWSMATNDIKMDFNGTAPLADTTAAIPAKDRLCVGYTSGATPYVFNGPVNHIYGWTRNLSQSELGAIDA